MSNYITKVQSVGISVGVSMDVKDAKRNAATFAREIGFAKAATQNLTDQLKVFGAYSKELNLTGEQSAIVENRLTAAHEKRTAKIREEAAAINQLRAAEAARAAAAKADTLGISGYKGTAGSGGSFVPSLGGSGPANNGLNLSAYGAGGGNQSSGGASMADAAAAVRQMQVGLAGWANGLANIGTSANAISFSRATAGAAAFAAGLANIASRAEAAKAATAALNAAQAGWANGLANIRPTGSSGSSAWAAGMNNIRNRNEADQEAHNATLQRGYEYMERFNNRQQEFNRQIREARTLLREGALTQEQYSRATAAIVRQNSLATASFNQLKGVVSTMLGPLVLAFAAYKAFTSSITLAANLDAARAKLKVFTGSVEEANRVLKDIRDLANSSPVSFAGGQRATTTMLQFGVSAGSVTKNLREIAEITGGDTERMESLALAFGQANAAGRLMGQELLQMVNAGFNPLKVISDQTGESMKSLKDRMSAGEISFQMIAKAFEDAVGPGGRFNGLLKEMADTTAGKLVQANSALEETGIAFGELIKPATDGVLSSFITQLKDLAFVMNGLRDAAPDVLSGLLGFSAGDIPRINMPGIKATYEDINAMMGDDLLAKINSLERAVDNGFGFLVSEEDLASIREYKKQLEEIAAAKKEMTEEEKAAAELQEQLRIQATFEDAKVKSKKDLNKSRYGDKGSNIDLLLSQATGEEARVLNRMVEVGAAYDDIVLAANAEAQAQLDVIDALQQKNKALEDGKNLEKETAAAAKERSKEQAKIWEEGRKEYEANLRDMEKQARAIKDAQNPYSELIDKLATAALLASRGMITSGELTKEQQRLSGDAVKSVNATAAPTFSRNSQEAYQFGSAQMVDKVNQQIQLAERQTIIAQTALAVATKTNEKLDELIEGQPKVLGP